MKPIVLGSVMAVATLTSLNAPYAAPSFTQRATQKYRAATAAENKAFHKIYSTIDAASLKRDVTLLRPLLASDFTIGLKSGTELNKEQYIRFTSSALPSVVKFYKVQSTIQRIRVYENTAVVLSTSTTNVTYRDPDQKQHRRQNVTQSMDSWILTKQGWQCRSVKELASVATTDGRRESSK